MPTVWDEFEAVETDSQPATPWDDFEPADPPDYKKQIAEAQKASASEQRKANLFGLGETVSRAGDVIQPFRTGFNYLQGVGKQAVDSALGYGQPGDLKRAVMGEPVAGAIRSDTPLIKEIPSATPEDFEAVYGVPRGVAETLSGLSQGAADLVNFAQTPEGIALFKIGKLPPQARAAAAGAIGSEIASQSPHIIQEFQEAKARGDKAGMAKAAFGGLVTVAGTAGLTKGGVPEIKQIPAIPETPLRSHADTIAQMRANEEIARQARVGSPFARAEAPQENIQFMPPVIEPLPEMGAVVEQLREQRQQLPNEIVNAGLPVAPADIAPSGLNVLPREELAQRPLAAPIKANEAMLDLVKQGEPSTVRPVPPTPGEAARALLERGAEQRRQADFPKALERKELEQGAQRAAQFDEAVAQREAAARAAEAQKVAAQQAIADREAVAKAKTIHPYKPLTDNQIRLMQEELRIALDANPIRPLKAKPAAAVPEPAPKAPPTVPPETVRGKATRVDILGDQAILDIVDEFKQKPAQSGPFTPEQLDAVLRKGWQWLKENPPELEKVLAATGKTADQIRDALARPLPVKEITGQKDYRKPGTTIRQFNLLEDIKDSEGKVLHSKESTLTEKDLSELGFKPQPFSSWAVSQKEYTAAKRNKTTGEILTDLDHDSIPGNGERGFVDNEGNFLTLMDVARREMAKADTQSGLIAGSALEKWANDKLKGKLLSPTPEDMAALAVKGAAQLERGVTDFARWSKSMTDAHGVAIKPQLKQIYEQSKAIRAGAFNKPQSQPSSEQGAGEPPTSRNITGEKSKAATGSSLEDVYRIFEPPEKTKTGVGQVASKIAESVRTGLSSKFRPLDKLAEDIAKAYGTVSKKGIAGIFEQLKGSRGRGEADIIRFDKDVSNYLKGNEKDFNAYMFLRRSLDRLEQDAATGEGRRKVAGYDIPELEAKLSLLESKIGRETLGQFETAAKNYQRHMDQALRLQVESGRMSEAVYEAIKNGNQFYAPFKVMKYIEETSRPEGTGKRVDTLADFTKAMKGIEDPNFRLGDMLGAARQSLLLSRILADKNNVMRKVADMAKDDTEGRFIKKLVGEQEAPNGWETINVLENGKPTKYATNPDVARALQAFGDASSGIISKTLSLFSIPFRAGATALNLPFQISNLMADVPRQALVSKYGIGFNNFLRYPFDFAHALLSSIAGDVGGMPNKLFMDFLDSGVAGVTVQEHLTPKALRTETVSTARKVGEKVLWAIPDFAAAIEQTSKVLGVKNAMKAHGVKSGAELAAKFPEAITELRRFSGSPDFGRQGMWTETARLNLLYMFFNARLQGTITDVGRLTGRDGAGTAAKTWIKVGTAVGLPTAYLYSLNNSEKYKDDYAQRPDQEKRNYWLIPKDTFITNENGEKMRDYWRIPKRESAKWVANLTESSLDFAKENDPESFTKFSQNMLEDISPVNVQGNTFQERAESVAASLNPVLKAPLEAATGRDMFRHRDIVPDSQQKASPEQQFTDTTAEAFKSLANAMPDVAPEVFRSPLMLENMTKNLTAGLLTQFLKTKPVEGRSDAANQPLLRRFQAVPFTEQTAVREEIQGLQREAADSYLKRHRTAQKLVSEGKGKELAEILQGAHKDEKLLRHTVDLWLAEQNKITNTERQILALPVDQRAKFISKQLKGMNPKQKEAAILNYAKKRILTEAVAAQIAEDLQP